MTQSLDSCCHNWKLIYWMMSLGRIHWTEMTEWRMHPTRYVIGWCSWTRRPPVQSADISSAPLITSSLTDAGDLWTTTARRLHASWRRSQSCGSGLDLVLLLANHIDRLLSSLSVCPSVCDIVYCGWLIHPTAKVSEQVNRKCPSRNTLLQLLNSLCPQLPPQKFRNFTYLLYLTFLSTWPFCLCCYDHGWVLLLRWC